LNALSLFSGIGGLDIAAEWAGFKTVAFCERDKFCKSVLAKHWPNTRIFNDVRTLPTSELPRIELLHGGYPCQPFSVAGRQKGHNDERHLWPAMFDIIRATRPAWIVAENVKGHIALGLDEVLRDLEGTGYAARPFVIPACAIGANHTRERVFVVANTAGDGRYDSEGCARPETADGNETQRTDEVSHLERCGRLRSALERRSKEAWGRGIKPGIRRVADGVPNRVDRLKSLGNAVVPAQAYPIFAAIAETYNSVNNTTSAGIKPTPSNKESEKNK